MMFEASLVLGCLTLGMDPVLAVSIVDELSGREPNAVSVGAAPAAGFRDNDRSGQRLVAISPGEAAALATGLMATASDRAVVRVGLMGIDATRLGSLEASLAEAFDPCTNLALGERLYLASLETATASGRTGEDAARAALRDYLGEPEGHPVGTDAVDAVWSRRPASERWLAARRTSVVAIRPRGDAPDTDADVDAGSGAVRPDSSAVAWRPRPAPSEAREATGPARFGAGR